MKDPWCWKSGPSLYGHLHQSKKTGRNQAFRESASPGAEKLGHRSGKESSSPSSPSLQPLEEECRAAAARAAATAGSWAGRGGRGGSRRARPRSPPLPGYPRSAIRAAGAGAANRYGRAGLGALPCYCELLIFVIAALLSRGHRQAGTQGPAHAVCT